MKEYECAEVKHHKDIGKTIQEWEKAGWRLHTYTTSYYAGWGSSGQIIHFLLFERGE